MKILVISASFAPRSASPAVRSVHLVRYLAGLGHKITVLTYDTEMQLLFSPKDESLSRKVPDTVEVIRIRAGVFHRYMASRKHRGSNSSATRRGTAIKLLSSLILPDPHIAAKSSFEKKATKIIERWSPDVLLTFSYPYTMVLVGSLLKRRFKHLIWAADYGDPWSGAPLRELGLPWWRKPLEHRMECRALQKVDLVTLTTQPTADLYMRQFPELGERIHVIPMGYDPEDVDTVAPAPRSPDTLGRILMIHTGRLYEEARDLGPFVAALDRLAKTDPQAAGNLRIHLLGYVSPYIRSLIASSFSHHIFSFSEWVPLEDCIAAMKSADCLLLFGNKGAVQIPGKLYQYIGTGRPILVTSESEDDPAANVLGKYEGARIVHNSVHSLHTALSDIAHGILPVGCNPSSRKEYAWSSLAVSLSQRFEEIMCSRSRT